MPHNFTGKSAIAYWIAVRNGRCIEIVQMPDRSATDPSVWGMSHSTMIGPFQTEQEASNALMGEPEPTNTNILPFRPRTPRSVTK